MLRIERQREIMRGSFVAVPADGRGFLMTQIRRQLKIYGLLPIYSVLRGFIKYTSTYLINV
jgi:hypothetical protein